MNDCFGRFRQRSFSIRGNFEKMRVQNGNLSQTSLGYVHSGFGFELGRTSLRYVRSGLGFELDMCVRGNESLFLCDYSVWN